tara:strand:+ start:670 stop:894 length:225 start_codon:yes stop_codon:yes gene_type:complete
MAMTMTNPLNQEELEALHYACADAATCWRYRRQSIQAGEDRFAHYTEEECTQNMKAFNELHDRLYWLVEAFHQD